jgi:hypothetical protein
LGDITATVMVEAKGVATAKAEAIQQLEPWDDCHAHEYFIQELIARGLLATLVMNEVHLGDYDDIQLSFEQGDADE